MKFKLIIAFLMMPLLLRAESLIVFMPTTIPISKIEKNMKTLTSFNVTAFAKYSDFESSIDSMQPDIVITTQAFEHFSEKYSTGPAIEVKGKENNKYILLSLDSSWKDKKLSEARIGAVEVIQRSRLKEYFDSIFSLKFKGMKTVSKAEDLFPLLVFKSVDVIAISPYIYEELKEKFNTKVYEVGQSKELSLLNVFIKKGKDLDAEIKKIKLFEYPTK